MDGTVNWARRDDGRPALAGTGTATGAAGTVFSNGRLVATGDFDLEETVVCIGLADVLETGMGTGLAGARGFGTDGATAFEAAGMDLAGALAVVFWDGTTGLALALATGFAATLAGALAGALTGALVGAFSDALGASLAVGLAGTLEVDRTAGLTGLASGFPLDLTAACNLLLAAAVLLTFPDLAFTSCLLADFSCAWSVGPAAPPGPLDDCFGGGSPARECTGFPKGKPISCKIETIIWRSL